VGCLTTFRRGESKSCGFAHTSHGVVFTRGAERTRFCGDTDFWTSNIVERFRPVRFPKKSKKVNPGHRIEPWLAEKLHRVGPVPCAQSWANTVPSAVSIPIGGGKAQSWSFSPSQCSPMTVWPDFSDRLARVPRKKSIIFTIPATVWHEFEKVSDLFFTAISIVVSCCWPLCRSNCRSQIGFSSSLIFPPPHPPDRNDLSVELRAHLPLSLLV
jgi:hypothetical protein